MHAVDLPARLEHDHRPAERQREADLGERAVATADRDHCVAGGDDREVARMADAGDDDVVEPVVHLGARLAGEDADRRAAAALRPARRSRHHLAAAAGDDGRSPLGEQPADLLGTLVVLGAATDDGDLQRHGVFSRCFAVNTPSSRSPCLRMRSSTTSIVNADGSRSSFTSSQRSGVETGAPARGRTEYTEAIVLPSPFWFESISTPRRLRFDHSVVASPRWTRAIAAPTISENSRVSSNV